jgi:hypothetical protein
MQMQVNLEKHLLKHLSDTELKYQLDVLKKQHDPVPAELARMRAIEELLGGRRAAAKAEHERRNPPRVKSLPFSMS